MGESIAVMFIFFLLIVAGFIFYSKIERTNITKEKDEADNLKAIEVAQVISFLPEVQCIKQNVQIYNCFDVLKLDAIKGIVKNNKLEYYDILQNSNITIKQIYPESNKVWRIYNNTGGNWTKRIRTIIPVSLFDSVGDHIVNGEEGKINPYFGFGVMEVDVFI